MANWQSMPLHLLAARITRLAADGSTPADAGSNSCYVTDKMMKIDFNNEVDEGPEITNRGASGLIVQQFKMKDLVKRLAISVELATYDPELVFILAGGSVLTSAATPLSAMGALGSSTATTGGVLAAGTYGYKAAALSQYGNTVASAEKTQVTTGATSTVTLTWSQVADAVGYRIYGRTSGGPWYYLATIAQAASPTWTDLGTLTPDTTQAAPTIDTSGVAPNGYAYPAVGTDPVPGGISFEGWSRNISQPLTPGYGSGQQIGQAPYIHWAWPRMYLTQRDQTIDGQNPVNPVFAGYAEENSNWGNGPFNDWDYASNRLVQWAYSDTLPTVQVGRVAVPAQV